MADADVSGANSSPYEPLNTVQRAIGRSLAQAITSRVTFELAQAADRLACNETIPIDPQQFAERSGVATIGLLFLPVAAPSLLPAQAELAAA